MPRFHVHMREVFVQTVEIQAKDSKEAIDKVRDGDGEYLNEPEYSRTMGHDTWSVEEIVPLGQRRLPEPAMICWWMDDMPEEETG